VRWRCRAKAHGRLDQGSEPPRAIHDAGTHQDRTRHARAPGRRSAADAGRHAGRLRPAGLLRGRGRAHGEPRPPPAEPALAAVFVALQRAVLCSALPLGCRLMPEPAPGIGKFGGRTPPLPSRFATVRRSAPGPSAAQPGCWSRWPRWGAAARGPSRRWPGPAA